MGRLIAFDGQGAACQPSDGTCFVCILCEAKALDGIHLQAMQEIGFATSVATLFVLTVCVWVLGGISVGVTYVYMSLIW